MLFHGFTARASQMLYQIKRIELDKFASSPHLASSLFQGFAEFPLRYTDSACDICHSVHLYG